MHRSLADLCRKAEEENRNFWEVVLEDDCRERQLSPEASFAQMRAMYRAMKDADASYDPTLYSRSGLTGQMCIRDRIMLPKDYLAYRLTGVHCTDVSDASGMLLFLSRRHI